ncbi:MAG: ABC transporter permease [Chloroflexi bacterium]|nr:ABC transporter permease [Chloroflexota bacterium]
MSVSGQAAASSGSSTTRRWLEFQAALYRVPLLMRFVKFYGAFILVIAIWLIAAQLLNPVYVPSPTGTVAAFGELMFKGILPAYVVDSIRHLVQAAIVGMAIAIPLGLGIGLNRYIASFFYPLLNFFQALSGIAWLPMFIIWFGFSEKTITVAINYTVVFPVAFNTLVGVRTVPKIYSNALRTMGASNWRIIRDVIVPGAFPNIVTGMRLGIAYGWRAMIAAEMVVGANGLGFMIFDAQSFGLTARIVLGMIIIGALWLIVDQLVLRPLERATIQRWGLVRS